MAQPDPLANAAPAGEDTRGDSMSVSGTSQTLGFAEGQSQYSNKLDETRTVRDTADYWLGLPVRRRERRNLNTRTVSSRRTTRRWGLKWLIGLSIAAAIAVPTLVTLWRQQQPGDKPSAGVPAAPAPNTQDAKAVDAIPPKDAQLSSKVPSVAADQIPDGQKILSVLVNDGPLSGEDSRATGDFTIQPPPGATRLKWRIVEPECRGAKFNLTRNVELSWRHLDARDHTELPGVVSDAVTPLVTGDKFYISAIRNAPKPFTVEAYAQ